MVNSLQKYSPDCSNWIFKDAQECFNADFTPLLEMQNSNLKNTHEILISLRVNTETFLNFIFRFILFSMYKCFCLHVCLSACTL